jgi:hypothetical protein
VRVDYSLYETAAGRSNEARRLVPGQIQIVSLNSCDDSTWSMARPVALRKGIANALTKTTAFCNA